MAHGALSALLARAQEDPDLAALAAGSHTSLAVGEAAQPFVIAALAAGDQPLVVAVPSASTAEHLAHDVGVWAGPGQVALFPAWETLPFERVSPAPETMGRRLELMWRLRRLRDGAPDAAVPPVIISPVRALLQRLGPHVEDTEPVSVRRGLAVDLDELVEDLGRLGYRREYQVEHRGEMAVRGSIVDVYPSTGGSPVRIDLWGDEVDRLTVFSVADQRSTSDLDEALIFGCRELLATPEVRQRAGELVSREPWGTGTWERLSEGLTFDGMESWLPWLTEDEHLLVDLLPEQARVLLVEPRRMRERALEIEEEEADLAAALATTWGAEGSDFPKLHLPFDRLLARTGASVASLFAAPEGPGTTVFAVTGWQPVLGGTDHLMAQLRDLSAKRSTIVVCAEGQLSAARLSSALATEGFVAPVAPVAAEAGQVAARGGTVKAGAGGAGAAGAAGGAGAMSVVVAPVDRGFIAPTLGLAVLAESDLTGRRRPHRAARPRAAAVPTFFDDMKTGDYVVHFQHGVARFAGMVRRSIADVERDYLLLEYRDGDKLYVPSDQVDALRPYTGGETPSLSRLNGSEWAKTKARVRSAVREIAQELVVLYRKRATTPGHAFPPDTPWQAEMEQAFPYTETPDQLKAIADVKADMEDPVPMDRLVCGDVGFGKTEVAVRATFKAVQDGKQVAILVPTTLLASQHLQTFSERFANYPVKVEMLSRFLTSAEARTVTDGLAEGSVDVVVGTHKLLAENVTFKNLGLLVVDEEQRFGVTHKEAIKKLSTNVDVLTMTASPIPRTLEMSLTGLRDLSLITTPPAERRPILTYVGEYDEHAVAEAIRRELLREGQVFFVHHRVFDIDKVAARLRELVPEARVAIANGQMDEGSLEKVVLDFWEGRYDVLVCTTIIESGIDMPTVNTLVIDRADMLGLGQLHQLRGRVGRANQRAYAYLFYPQDHKLTEEAYERLRTIGEHTELGSGFKIAMRDLEIRGAGNLLGADQSGHIAAVGYDLYVQMVSEAVAELKGETLKQPAEIRLDLPMTANLPESYVSREDLRLEAYRRLATLTTPEEVDDIASEWLDRYGPLPAQANALLSIARLRAECARLGAREVAVVSGGIGTPFGGFTARISPLALRASEQVRLSRIWPRAVYKEDQGQLVGPLKKSPDPAQALVDLLRALVPPAPPESGPAQA
ncbi:MAG TPA: transcription-repair coupling factor [Acidimicrobiales bacterium]|nr:transcription-repair coupling factor [Acidimicrobiales bacterium]